MISLSLVIDSDGMLSGNECVGKEPFPHRHNDSVSFLNGIKIGYYEHSLLIIYAVSGLDGGGWVVCEAHNLLRPYLVS